MQIYCLKPDCLHLLQAMCICYGIWALPFHGKQRWRLARTGALIGCGHAVTQGEVPGRAAHLQLTLAVNGSRGGVREHTTCVSFSCCTRRTSPCRGSCAESSSSFCPSQSMISWRGTCSFPLWSEKASSRALAGEQGQQDSGQTDRERSRFPQGGETQHCSWGGDPWAPTGPHQ